MRKKMNCFAFLLALVLGGQVALCHAAERATLTLTDKPVRIIRGASLFKGVVGVDLQKDDIIETESGTAQIQASSEMMILMAPKTRIYVVNIGGAGVARTEITVLSGWLKVVNKLSGTNGRVVLTSPLMRIDLDDGVSIVHRSEAKAEMFAEEGGQAVVPFDARGKAGVEFKVAREEYVLVMVGLPPKVMSRAPKEFLTQLPIAFHDKVRPAPDRLKGANVVPVKEREVDYADIAPWLTSTLPVRKSFVGRFSVRLSDPVFRKSIETEVGQLPDWKGVLNQALNPTPTPTKLPSILF